eukprot:TRINITY_DN3627_c0_g1_i1.p1 TRINITY_DN3627_c0_g1~~TRINITY_DN3627_c0_g1_i1.p1  ORF type:complete len:984 (-),score=144.64 TRINITY_DN3627_c0_g1_i1:280-3231(-)
MSKAPNMQTARVDILAGRTVKEGFSVRGATLGRGGQNLRFITEQTGIRIKLEGATSSAMYLRLVGGRADDMKTAESLAKDLIKQVGTDYAAWLQRDSRRTQPAAKPVVRQQERRAPAKPSAPARHAVSADEAPKLFQAGDGAEAVSCHWPALVSSKASSSSTSTTAASSSDCPPASSSSGSASSAGSEPGQAAPQEARAGFADLLKSLSTSQGSGSWPLREKPRPAVPPVPAAHPDQPARRRERPGRPQVQRPQGARVSGSDRMAGFCALYPLGACPLSEQECPRGCHGEPGFPAEASIFAKVTQAKKRLIQEKWSNAGGSGTLVNVWQVRNPRLDFLFRASECDFAKALGHSSDIIDGWHGSAEDNIYSIAMNGFDTKRRCGQAFGEGEYFAKDPAVSVGYARGGSFMFLCKLLLGQEDLDHTWVDSCQYYVLKQRESRVQAVPLYVVQFAESDSQLSQKLVSIQAQDTDETTALATQQRGGLRACEARRDAGMSANTTRHLWIGWLDPSLCQQDNDAITEDVKTFLKGVEVEDVIPERNGARVGAFVLLEKTITKAKFEEVSARLYRGQHRISVDDQQPDNPRVKNKVCPRLTGPSHYCRGWNISGHHSWQWRCPFKHPDEARSTHHASYTAQKMPRHSAKFNEIEAEFMQGTDDQLFTGADGCMGKPRIVAVKRIVNRALERLYGERRGFMQDKHGFAVEKELWHGTNCKTLPNLLTHGLQPPSDMEPAEECPVSGGKGLCTTLCGNSCRHCRAPHEWARCHMYGLGVYMADLAHKSHRYVREPCSASEYDGPVAERSGPVWQIMLGDAWYSYDIRKQREIERAYQAGNAWYTMSKREGGYKLDFDMMMQIDEELGEAWPFRRLEHAEDDDSAQPQTAAGAAGPRVYSMLRCRVLLGNPYLIEGNLLKDDAMHNMCWCQDPSESLESAAESWCTQKGHDAFFIRGQAGAQKHGLGVYNSEYVLFHPYQILPMYQIDYVVD